MTPTINVILIDLPVNEAVTENADGSFTIFINARLNNDGQLKAYEHALEHIKQNDFEKHDVQAIEAAAHKKAPLPGDKYMERLRSIQRSKKRLQAKIKKDQKRVEFMRMHYDLYKLAERRYLYGDDM